MYMSFFAPNNTLLLHMGSAQIPIQSLAFYSC